MTRDYAKSLVSHIPCNIYMHKHWTGLLSCLNFYYILSMVLLQICFLVEAYRNLSCIARIRALRAPFFSPNNQEICFYV